MIRLDFFLRAALAAMTIAVAAPAFGEDIAVNVTGGRRTMVGDLAIYDSFSCTAMAVPETKIGRPPAHGRLDIAVERRNYKTERCGTVSIVAPVVYYTPNKGFRGQDEAAVDFIFFAFAEGHETTNRRQSYQITVK
jgi:hypothetical protein